MKTPSKQCRHCKNSFLKPVNCSRKDWITRVCCSKECADASKKTPWLKNFYIQKGQNLSKGTQFNKNQTSGKKNVNWKGDQASYAAKHIWVKYHYGKPNKCQHCKTTEIRMYHWANISGEYLRKRSDWLRLCVPCHKRYDLSK